MRRAGAVMAVCGVSALWRLRSVFSQTVTGLRACVVKESGRYHSSLHGDEFDVEDDFEPENVETEAIKSAIKRQQKAMKFQRMKREFEPHGPPERTLSWNAIEQIRYLRQEFPEEWTLQRLAEGFNVSHDVIRRVLRSKFSPPEKRKLKQDVTVSKLLGQKVVQDARNNVTPLPPGTKDSGARLLPSGSNGGQTSLQKYIPPGKSQSADLALRTESTLVQRKPEGMHLPAQYLQHNPPTVICPESKAVAADLQADQKSSHEEEQEGDLDEEWDGELLSDGELEELAEKGVKNHMQVVQKGREFFDDNGKFLYRI